MGGLAWIAALYARYQAVVPEAGTLTIYVKRGGQVTGANVTYDIPGDPATILAALLPTIADAGDVQLEIPLNSPTPAVRVRAYHGRG